MPESKPVQLTTGTASDDGYWNRGNLSLVADWLSILSVILTAITLIGVYSIRRKMKNKADMKVILGLKAGLLRNIHDYKMVTDDTKVECLDLLKIIKARKVGWLSTELKRDIRELERELNGNCLGQTIRAKIELVFNHFHITGSDSYV